jgi:hypothetical protein
MGDKIFVTRVLDLRQRKSNQRMTWLSDVENAYYKLSNNIELMYLYKDTSMLGDYKTDLTPVTKSSWFYSNLGYDIQQK